jgi:hypothetical protein
VTDHAADRYRQRVRGTLDPKAEISRRVGEAWAAGRAEELGGGDVRIRDLRDRALVFVGRHDLPRGELVIVSLWEEGEEARVPRRFTDALRAFDPPPRRER